VNNPPPLVRSLDPLWRVTRSLKDQRPVKEETRFDEGLGMPATYSQFRAYYM
jgi:hypothetical protein